MNGHAKRRQRIIRQIKDAALDLYKECGEQKVSMDAIAARACVSKVTIYKYFHSKTGLRKEVIGQYTDELLAETERALEGDLNIVDKLKIILLAEANAPRLANSQELFELLDDDVSKDREIVRILQDRIRALMYRVYQEGVKEGYIDISLSFELVNLYAEIFQAGIKAKATQLEAILDDPGSFEKLMHLFYFGIFEKKSPPG